MNCNFIKTHFRAFIQSFLCQLFSVKCSSQRWPYIDIQCLPYIDIQDGCETQRSKFYFAIIPIDEWYFIEFPQIFWVFFPTKFERENKKSSTINIFLMEHFTNKIITAQTYSKCWWCVDGALFRCVHTCTKISLSLVCGEFRTLIVSLTGAKLSLFVPVSIPHKTQSRFFSRKNRENSPSSLIKIHRKYFWIKFWTIIYRLHTIYHHLHEYFSYFERKKDYLSRRHYQSML